MASRTWTEAGVWLARAALCALLALHAATAEGAVLREARFDVVYTSPTDCEVNASFVVEGTTTVEHRLIVGDSAVVTLREVGGTVAADGGPVAVGASRSLTLRGAENGEQRYRLGYAVSNPASPYRCPLWLPTTPADGVSQEVVIGVALPAGVMPDGASLPAFDWEGRGGTAHLGHIPAFIRVPFRAEGSSRRFSVGVNALMDGIAITVLAAGVTWFAWRRRRA
ncbi:MAG TPA: hypothetical protein VGD94_23345 [Vicinamibacterales bacterium]